MTVNVGDLNSSNQIIVLSELGCNKIWEGILSNLLSTKSRVIDHGSTIRAATSELPLNVFILSNVTFISKKKKKKKRKKERKKTGDVRRYHIRMVRLFPVSSDYFFPYNSV